MADMGEMEMPLPDNTLPMMTGQGQFGALEMGGMFTVIKVREGLGRNDYKDPGPYRFPAGTQAYKWTGQSLNVERAPSSRATEIDPATGNAIGKREAAPAAKPVPQREIVLDVKKPGGHAHH
jgi:hypothetical protein